MKIFLDTKDLIDIVDKSKPISAEDFENKLRVNNHELILSFSNVIEISRPLLNRDIETNVMVLLNRIEMMPIKFIITDIDELELKEAIGAFSQGREYRQINPFVDRFDKTLVDPSPTKNYLHFSLAEAIFTLWTEDSNLFTGMTVYTTKLREIFKADRTMSEQPDLNDHFVEVIRRNLNKKKGLTIPLHKLEALATWIYENPKRCPSIRLSYEVYHKILKNIEDTPKEGDIYDLSNISCIPYVDLVTIDRRMYSYVIQACKRVGFSHESKIYRSVDGVFNKLG